MYSTSGNYTLDVLFYEKEIEIKTFFSANLTKSKSVAFSLLYSIYKIFYCTYVKKPGFVWERVIYFLSQY